MTRGELNAAIEVVKRHLAGITVMGMNAASFVTDEQISNITQDALQAAEDVRKARENG